MTTFSQIAVGQKFKLPDSISSMEKGSIYEKLTNKSFMQVFPQDMFALREIKPRTLENRVELAN